MFSLDTLQLAVIALNKEDKLTELQLNWISNAKKHNAKIRKK